MISWWQNMILTQQIFALFAVPATIVLVIQTILLLIGMGTQDGDADGVTGEAADDLADETGQDIATDPGLRLLTVRGLVAFFSIGGWVGIALIDLAVHPVLASLFALIAGFLALLLVAWIVKIALSLQSAGNLDVRNAIGQTGRVYLTIPGGGRYSGKVSLLVQERAVELDAYTEEHADIPTGSQVKVIGLRGNQLIVAAIQRPAEQKENPAAPR